MSEPTPAAPEDLSEWSAVITPEQGWFDLRLREVWAYRDLIYLFCKRDFVASYKQTILGPFWFFAQPVATAIVFWVVFGRVGKIVTPCVPQFLFFMAGIILWQFFSQCLIKTATTLNSNAGIFGKVYFPRLTVPLSVTLTQGITFLIQFVLFLVMFGVAWKFGVPVHPNWRVIILPLLLVQIAALALGVGCIVAALTTRFRDLAFVIQFGVNLAMYASCVVFPLENVPLQYRGWMLLNPMVPIIEGFRYAFIGYGVCETWHLLVSAGITAVIFFIGLVMFRHVEKTAMDTV
jgi:lipopolysaccharide transport system permease protein